MATNPTNPKILLDSDVIRHFLKADSLLLLPKIYPKRLVILDIVKNELCRSKSLITPINNFISFSKIEILDFTGRTDIMSEYVQLQKRGFGEGESACMAVARFDKQIIASSNLRDIQKYCSDNSITYITTMDILVEAFEKKHLTESECDYFIYNVKSKGSKLPCDTIKEYIKKYLNK